MNRYRITIEKIEGWETKPCAVMTADRVSVSIAAVVEEDITDTGERHITIKAWSGENAAHHAALSRKGYGDRVLEKSKIISVVGRRQSGYDETTAHVQRTEETANKKEKENEQM